MRDGLFRSSLSEISMKNLDKKDQEL